MKRAAVEASGRVDHLLGTSSVELLNEMLTYHHANVVSILPFGTRQPSPPDGALGLEKSKATMG